MFVMSALCPAEHSTCFGGLSFSAISHHNFFFGLTAKSCAGRNLCRPALFYESEKMASSELAFVHIPKCAGTAIEDAALAAVPQVRWGRRHAEGVMVGLGKGVPFEAGTPASSTVLRACSMYFRLRDHHYGVNRFHISWNRTSCCSWWHIPPSALPASELYYHAPIRFCVVRDPYLRLMSDYLNAHPHLKQMNGSALCGKVEHMRINFHTFALNRMALSSRGDYYDCHMLPQARFVASNWVYLSTLLRWEREEAVVKLASQEPGCNVVLSFERLQSEFPQLMSWAGLNINLTAKVPTVSSEHRGAPAPCFTPDGARAVLRSIRSRSSANTDATHEKLLRGFLQEDTAMFNFGE